MRCMFFDTNPALVPFEGRFNGTVFNVGAYVYYSSLKARVF